MWKEREKTWLTLKWMETETWWEITIICRRNGNIRSSSILIFKRKALPLYNKGGQNHDFSLSLSLSILLAQFPRQKDLNWEGPAVAKTTRKATIKSKCCTSIRHGCLHSWLFSKIPDTAGPYLRKGVHWIIPHETSMVLILIIYTEKRKALEIYKPSAFLPCNDW